MIPELAKIVLALFVFINMVPLLVYFERKISARIQKRYGPNRVGPFGILQPVADAIKLFTKEDLVPPHVNRWLFIAAPALVMLPGALAFAVIPFGNQIQVGDQLVKLQIADLNVGVLYLLAMTSLGVYGISFGGWASNNKFSLLGGVRSTAQLVSYEVAMGLALVSVLMSAGDVYLPKMVEGQTGGFASWHIISQPLAFAIFLVAAFAETNRLPFDLPECEAELVGGYHTEYSSMKFALFFMGEYLAMVTMSALIVTLFLGGWHWPGMDPGATTLAAGLLSCGVFLAKVCLVLFFYIWVRWSLPRLRYDQLMDLGWKVLVPLGLVNILVTGLLGVARARG